MRRLGHVPSLDGLRGLAIALVIGRHYFNLPVGGGGVGVDLFFVLSGFLITTLLLEEHAVTGSIRLRAFYVRRARRLAPALIFMLAVYLIGAEIQGRGHAALRAVAAGGFYTANIAQAYWPHLMGREPIGPLWSLAEEEQFYLLWPALLLLTLTLAVAMRRVKAGLLIVILVICVERFWLIFGSHAPVQRIYASPESAADGLVAGVLLAFVLATRQHLVSESAGELALAALVPLGLVTLLSSGAEIYGPVVDGAGIVLVALALDQTTRVSKVFSSRPLVWLGLISYSLYLWHMVVFSWFGGRERGLALAASLAMAWLSYRFIETRFRCRRQVATPQDGRILGPLGVNGEQIAVAAAPQT